MPRPPGLPKTGGRSKGTTNKPKPIVLENTPENQAMLAAAVTIRTPKAVMLDAMLRFESIGLGFLAKADKLMKTRADPDKVADTAREGHKFIVAAVECATKVAPYIHARLLAVEARGDMTEDKAPYVVRVPSVMADSVAWQAAVGMAILEQAGGGAQAGGPVEPMAHPALPQPQAEPAPAPAPPPVPLVADQKTGRISTAMPPGPATVKPTGSQEWLDTVAASRKAG